MISVDAKEEIRRGYYLKEKSIRQIQRETGHHRVTIRKALEDGLVGKYELKGSRACPVLDRVKPVIDTWLAEDAKRPRKERHTAKRIWDRLCTEHGFAGGVSTVRRYVGQRRRELGQIRLLDYTPRPCSAGEFRPRPRPQGTGTGRAGDNG